MKRLLLICGLLWSAVASAQFVPGQLLTAAELNSAFANTAPAPGITCLGASSALNYTSNVFSCNAAINAATLGGATFSAPGPIGSVSTSTGAFSSITTPSATIGGGSINATTVGASSPSTGSFTTLSATSTVSGTGFTTLLSPYLLSATASSTYAPLASPTFTGTPVAPTAAAGTNTTQLATTANVVANFATPPTAGYGSTTPEPVAATTLSSTGNFTPSQTNGIVGTTTNNNANAGSVGETISSIVASGSAIPLTTITNANVTSIPLTAGDWDVSGAVQYVASGATSTSAQSSFGTTSVTIDPTNVTFSLWAMASTTTTVTAPLAANRLSLPAPATVYLVARCNFTVGTVSAYGFLIARRRR